MIQIIKKTFKHFDNNKIFFILTFTLLLFLNPQESKANWFDFPFAAADATIGNVIKSLLWGIVLLLTDVVLPMVISFFNYMAGFQNFYTDGVNTAWTVTRDFANLFFALMLLFIAISTALNIEVLKKYNAKSLMPKFIFAALFINFSKAIVGFFLDISQIIMFEFYNALGTDIGGIFRQQTKLIDLMKASGEAGIGNTDQAMMHLVTIGLLILFISTLLWGGITLAIRLVTIWALIATAPLAFVASIVPPLQKYWSEWQSKLTEALVSGPIFMFFTWLSLIILSKLPAPGSGASQVPGGNLFLDNGNIFNYVIVITFMFLANTEAKKGAAQAPGFVKDFADSAMGYGTFGLAGYLGQSKVKTGQVIKDGVGVGDRIPILGKRMRRSREDFVNTAEKGKFLNKWKTGNGLQRFGAGAVNFIAQGANDKGRENSYSNFKSIRAQKLVQEGQGGNAEIAEVNAIESKALNEDLKYIDDKTQLMKYYDGAKKNNEIGKMRAALSKLSQTDGGINHFMNTVDKPDASGNTRFKRNTEGLSRILAAERVEADFDRPEGTYEGASRGSSQNFRKRLEDQLIRNGSISFGAGLSDSQHGYFRPNTVDPVTGVTTSSIHVPNSDTSSNTNIISLPASTAGPASTISDPAILYLASLPNKQTFTKLELALIQNPPVAPSTTPTLNITNIRALVEKMGINALDNNATSPRLYEDMDPNVKAFLIAHKGDLNLTGDPKLEAIAKYIR